MKTTTAPSAERDAGNSAKIMRIRLAHGGDADRCPTCCHAPDAPYRRVIDGVIVEGCIDAIHTGHLSGDSEAWHQRDVARSMRTEGLARLTSLTA